MAPHPVLVTPRPPQAGNPGVAGLPFPSRQMAAGSCTAWGTEPPTQPFPVVLRQSPPLAHPGFHRRLGRSWPPYTARLLPAVHPPSHRPRCHGSGRTGREVPTLGPATCRLPPTVLPMLPDSAFPPTRFHSSGYSSRSIGDPLQAGGFGAERELHPPRYRPSYRAPPIGFGSAGHPIALSPLVSRDTLSTGLLRTRHRAMGSPYPAGGTRTPFPRSSPRGLP